MHEPPRPDEPRHSVSATPNHWLSTNRISLHTRYFAFVLGTGCNWLDIAGGGGCGTSIGHRVDYVFTRAGCDCLVVDKTSTVPRGYRRKSSRETKFSGVHKDNCAARGLGALTESMRSRTVLKNLVQSGTPASRLVRFSRAKSKVPIISNRMLAQIKGIV